MKLKKIANFEKFQNVKGAHLLYDSCEFLSGAVCIRGYNSLNVVWFDLVRFAPTEEIMGVLQPGNVSSEVFLHSYSIFSVVLKMTVAESGIEIRGL